LRNVNDWFSSVEIENEEELKIKKDVANSDEYIYRDVVDFYNKINDKNKTPEENKRDEKITSLLEEYLDSYQAKNEFIKTYKKELFNISITWGTALVVMIVWLPIAYYFLSNRDSIIDVTGIITSIATFVGLIFGLLKIITSYIFSPDDEKNITTIVQSIQQNDLENKKENLKHKLALRQDVNENKKSEKEKEIRNILQDLQKLVSEDDE
jgi:predicted PurR-regulated permease PerM